MATDADRSGWIRAVAACGLPTRRPWPDEPLPDPDLDGLVAEAEQHRVVGLLGEAVRTGALPVTADQHDRIELVVSSWLGHALRVERLAQRTATALTGAGIDHRFLKGLPLAHTTYPDPAWRVVGDVDLLVRSTEFTKASIVLAAALDGTRALPELRPGFDDRFGREIMLRVGAFEVDLHRTFVDGALGTTIELDDLFVPGTTFRLGTDTLTTLPAPHRLLHACYASLLGDWPPRRMAQRDVVQLTMATPSSEVDAVLELAARWRARAVAAAAVKAAWDALEVEAEHPLVDWARAHRTGRVDRLLLAAYLGTSRGYTSQAASVLVLPGVRDRAAYVWALARPSDEYLAARGLRRGDLRRRTTAALRRGRPPRS